MLLNLPVVEYAKPEMRFILADGMASKLIFQAIDQCFLLFSTPVLQLLFPLKRCVNAIEGFIIDECNWEPPGRIICAIA